MKEMSENTKKYLADLRTVMANERTLLSYYRSAVAMVGLAAFVIKFYEGWLIRTLAGIILVFGLVVAYFGTKRYWKQWNKIDSRR